MVREVVYHLIKLLNLVSGKVVPRKLISTGLNGAVIEWDLINLQPRKIIDIGDVGIWNCVSIGHQSDHFRLHTDTTLFSLLVMMVQSGS